MSDQQPRYNARGDAYCYECKTYLPVHRFRPWPGQLARPGKLWPYCKECTRKLDRLRYHAKVSTPAGRALEMKKRNRRDRAQKRREYADRRETVANAIAVLNKRGLTNTDISEILGVHRISVGYWRDKRRRRILPAIVNRFLALLMATKDWPLLDRPAFRRRLPHPKRDELRAALHPTLLQFPVRDPWVNRRKQAA